MTFLFAAIFMKTLPYLKGLKPGGVMLFNNYAFSGIVVTLSHT
ncbi:hypothetical protein HMPREF1602_04155 [Escherichia coli 907889]|nr:hypothetical protein CSC09_0356 [Escherichia coli]ESA76643.1 hypothetical protein HMPREF1588_01469 [Escherichia coli 110957]ESD34939.1 hypothetical protein HMPREF1602_04155 [Escherichia coli 907889]